MEIVFTLMVLTTLAHAFVTHLLAHYCHEFLNPETRGKILQCSANYKRMLVTLGQNAGSTKSFPCGDNGSVQTSVGGVVSTCFCCYIFLILFTVHVTL